MIFNRKSQVIVGRIFIYIITLVLVAFLVIYGYKSVMNIRKQASEGDYLAFQSELRRLVRMNKNYGNEAKEALQVPDVYNEVCFVSYYSLPLGSEPSFPPGRSIPNKIIDDSVRQRYKENIFLIVDDKTMDSFLIENIKVNPDLDPIGNPDDDNFGCILVVNGKIKLKLNGDGDKTIISTY